MPDYTKPLPLPDELTKPFWDATRDHKFQLQHCDNCSRYIHPPKPRCPQCQGSSLSWKPVSGSGAVNTFTTVYHTGQVPGFQPTDVPYIGALIDLDEQEGLRFVSNVVGCDVNDVRVGMRVQARFDDVTPEVTLIKFAPAP